MITLFQSRKKPEEAKPYETTNQETPIKALLQLMDCEFGWSATVETLTPTSVSVMTRVMGCKDTTILSGSEEDMALIVKATAYYSFFYDQIFKPEFRKNFAKSVLEFTGGNPRVVALSAGVLVGEKFLKATLLALLCEDDVQYITRLKNITQKDLMSMLELKVIDKMEMHEILELV